MRAGWRFSPPNQMSDLGLPRLKVSSIVTPRFHFAKECGRPVVKDDARQQSFALLLRKSVNRFFFLPTTTRTHIVDLKIYLCLAEDTTLCVARVLPSHNAFRTRVRVDKFMLHQSTKQQRLLLFHPKVAIAVAPSHSRV
jgi:hypothetical protein